jgi:hypothetical protein
MVARGSSYQSQLALSIDFFFFFLFQASTGGVNINKNGLPFSNSTLCDSSQNNGEREGELGRGERERD